MSHGALLDQRRTAAQRLDEIAAEIERHPRPDLRRERDRLAATVDKLDRRLRTSRKSHRRHSICGGATRRDAINAV